MKKLTVVIGVGLLSVGCQSSGGSPGNDTDAGTGGASGGLFIPDTTNPTASCAVPSGPWGQSAGHLLQGWTINDCDGRPYTLHNDDFCTASATVLIQSEGWCGVCMEDAEDVYETLIEPYGNLGVRFMEVLSVDDQYEEIQGEFCHEWASRYGIEGFTFMDPESKLSSYSYRVGIDETPTGSTTLSLPVVRILDNTGNIVAMIQGGDTAWSRVRAQLDTLLAAQ